MEEKFERERDSENGGQSAFKEVSLIRERERERRCQWKLDAVAFLLPWFLVFTSFSFSFFNKVFTFYFHW